MNDDELLARLRAADPARTAADPRPELDRLLEAAMRTEPDTRSPTDRTAPVRRRPWILAAAAVALVAALGGGWVVTRGGGDPPLAGPSPSVTDGGTGDDVLALSAPDAPAGRCIPFSSEALQPMQSAFEGTVTSVSGDEVTLGVTRWYRGGDADVVELTNPSRLAIVLDGVITFEEGERYLLTATDGTLNVCGFSAPWSAEREREFLTAFGEGRAP